MPPRSPASSTPPAAPPPLDTARRTSTPASATRSLSCIALALALLVLLWGFGYKLSLYHPHRDSHARMPARLWLEPGPDRNLQLPARAYAFAVPHASGLQHGPLPLRNFGRATLPAAAPLPRFAFQALLPSRAPPRPPVSGSPA